MKNWYWEQRSLPTATTGAQVWEALFEQESTTVLLESPAQVLSKISRYSIAAGKPRQAWTPPVGHIFTCLQELLDLAKSRSPQPPLERGANSGGVNSPLERGANSWGDSLPEGAMNLPFTGGYLGWLGYDTAWEIEKLPYLKSDRLPFPVAFWYEPESFVVVDHQENLAWLAASSPEQLQEMRDRLAQFLAHPTPFEESGQRSAASGQLEEERADSRKLIADSSNTLEIHPNSAAFQTIIRKAKTHIQAGDIFQTNLSLRYSTDWTGEGWDLYKHLQQINPSPFASYWRTEWGEVISVSPERLVQLQGDRIATRPIAGTRPRGATAQADQQQEAELLACAKEQAEHIMLVDLERNDLGRVCAWGSVEVDELLAIERYSHVMHIVSNVVGKLRSDRTPIDLIKAVFPGGTITGCPKVRCMEIIETLEPNRRSLFYGACGYIDQRGNLDLNILIRTLLKSSDRICGQVGAGIVADSVPEREWQESLDKARAQLSALGISYTD